MMETVLTKWQSCWKVSSLWEALLALWCHLWAYFGFFLLATDITVPAKFCSVSWAVLHKKYCSAFYSHPSLSLWKYHLLAHHLWDPFHWCISVQVKEVSLGGPSDLGCPSICVYSWTDHYKQECSVWHLCISSCSGSCSSFLTPAFKQASLGRVSTKKKMVEGEVGQRISIKGNLMKD